MLLAFLPVEPAYIQNDRPFLIAWIDTKPQRMSVKKPPHVKVLRVDLRYDSLSDHPDRSGLLRLIQLREIEL